MIERTKFTKINNFKISKRTTNLINKKFGRLTVLKVVGIQERSEAGRNRSCPVWKCKCTCGRTIAVSHVQLINNKTKSCGCLSSEKRTIYKLKQINDLIGSTKTLKVVNPLLKLKSNRARMLIAECIYCERLHRIVYAELKTLKGCIRRCYESYNIMLNLKFDNYKILGKAKENNRWICLCKCGKQFIRRTESIIKWKMVRGCGCMPRPSKTQKTIEELLYKRYRTSAKIRSLKFDVSLKKFTNLIKRNCYYCGSPPATIFKRRLDQMAYNGLDRKDNKKGYLTNNITTCCKECNLIKGSINYIEFINWINRLKRHKIQTIRAI